MKLVIQRVEKANVKVEDTIIGEIGKGYVILLGVSDEDTKQIADNVVKKVLSLRIFSDENDKMNLSIQDIGGELLVISQFTLYADCSRGNRPSFMNAGKPEHANELYEYCINQWKEAGLKVEKGKFGANMKINLVNDGPVTIILDI